MVQLKQDGLKLNGKHQLLVYADSVNILEWSVHSKKENAESLIVAGRKTGLEVNAGKSKYIFMVRDQSAGRILNMKTESKSCEMGE